MAQLSAFKINSKARRNGEWVNPGPEYDGLELLCRGYTDEFVDARDARLRRAAARANVNDPSKLPNAVSRTILVDTIGEFLLLDVRGLKRDDGTPVTFPEFLTLLSDPDYPDFLNAATRAAAMVGQRRDSDIEAATGN